MAGGRVVGISRIYNEEHLIEAFVRHHAAMLDKHIILDNGSVDRTLEILSALQAEGLSVEVYRSSSVVYAEGIYNTGLYRLAVQGGADWVVLLDCDEMLDLRRVPEGLAAFLGGIPASQHCVQVLVVNYLAASPQSQSEVNPFTRLTRRNVAAHMSKVIVRGMHGVTVTVAAGNHHITVDGLDDWGFEQSRVVMAHFPDRSPCQMATKAIIGRLKVLASGQCYKQLNPSWHYNEAFEALKMSPRVWLEQAESEAARRAADGDLVHDPLVYLGGALRHTREPDDTARMVALLVRHAEALALAHGTYMDGKPEYSAEVFRHAGLADRIL